MATKPKQPAHPKQTLVLLVRHGRTPTTGSALPGRAKGLHLSPEGKAEAQAVAERLSGVPVTAIYASPLERARETAAPLSKALAMPVRIHRGLLECEFGDWTGRKLADSANCPSGPPCKSTPADFASLTANPSRKCRPASPGQSRYWSHATRAQPSPCLHAYPIKAAVAHALGTHLDLFQRISISTCSVTAIAYGASGPNVLTVNETGNLAALKPS